MVYLILTLRFSQLIIKRVNNNMRKKKKNDNDRDEVSVNDLGKILKVV
jgi:hypothetical protein